MRKHSILASFAILSITSLAACGGSSSKSTEDSPDSGEIVISGYSGIFEDKYKEAVIEPFEKEYPNIKVNYRGVKNSAENLAAIRANAGGDGVDVAIMDISVAQTGYQQDLLTALDPKQVSNLEDIDDRGKVDGNEGAAVTFDSLVIVYNEQLKQEPKTWDAFYDKSLSGDIVITAHPDIQGTSLMLIENAKAGGDYKESVDAGVSALTKIAPSVQTWAPQPDQYTLVQSGNAKLAVAWNARSQVYADESDGKLKVAIPEDPTVFQINTINLAANSSSPQAAQTFINYALSPEAQANFTETMFYAPTNTKAEPSAEALSRTAADPKYVETVMDVDWSFIAEKRDEWTEVWRREILQ